MTSLKDFFADLAKKGEALKERKIIDLFQENPQRASEMSCQAAGIYLDYSKNLIDQEGMDYLVNHCKSVFLEDAIKDLFAGKIINKTEQRSVLHMALRSPKGLSYCVEGQDLSVSIHRVLDRLYAFAEQVRAAKWLGYTGKPIRSVVNIGIGGSDLGPAMVTEALSFYQTPNLQFHFVSNVDGQQISQVLQKCDPEETLFIVASKTFTTQETLTNAHTARQWVLQAFADDAAIAKHFVAVSTNADAVQDFGISLEHMFEFWDWVGGRFSVWSAIGLPVILAIGEGHFKEFLAGAYAMDQHFQTASLSENMPVLLALIGIWNINGLQKNSLAILPYDQSLHRLPAYLQQAEMESNGKSVSLEGEAVHWKTAPIVFGEAGTNGQHAFYQLLHQGTVACACDFILPIKTHYATGDHHAKLIANFLAQQEAFLIGRSADQVRVAMQEAGAPEAEIASLKNHRSFAGNKPCNSLLIEEVSPYHLGALIALYEHKIFVQGFLWQVNSYDQWGVELGKELASRLLPLISSECTEVEALLDPSTAALLSFIRKKL